MRGSTSRRGGEKRLSSGKRGDPIDTLKIEDLRKKEGRHAKKKVGNTCSKNGRLKIQGGKVPITCKEGGAGSITSKRDTKGKRYIPGKSCIIERAGQKRRSAREASSHLTERRQGGGAALEKSSRRGFMSSKKRNKKNRSLRAFQEKRGKKVWKRELPRGVSHNISSRGFSARPAGGRGITKKSGNHGGAIEREEGKYAVL